MSDPPGADRTPRSVPDDDPAADVVEDGSDSEDWDFPDEVGTVLGFVVYGTQPGDLVQHHGPDGRLISRAMLGMPQPGDVGDDVMPLIADPELPT